MKGTAVSETLQSAADRVSRTGRQVREMASGLAERTEDAQGGTAAAGADALGAAATSLERVAESARASGSALRDHGRDAAKALARGERVLREGGLPGAAIGAAVLARRHAAKIAVAGAGLLALGVIARLLGDDRPNPS